MQSLVTLGHRFCDLLAQGETVAQIMQPYINAAANGSAPMQQTSDMGVVGGAAVKYFCPQYTLAIKLYLATGGTG